jgi:hypothetical protein
MKYTAFACVTQDTYVRTQEMAQQNDWEAVARMLVGRQCTRLERGQAVEVEDVTWGGLVQIRLRGRTQGWWTAIELVERVPPPKKP